MPGTDSLVQINEGTGKGLAYIQRSVASNTVYQQNVVVTEAYVPTYTISVTTAASTATANSHLLQVVAGPLNRVLLRRVLVTQLANAGSSTEAAFQLVRLTTAGSGGTSFTPVSLDPTNGVTAVTAQTLPTAKGTEGSILWTGTGNLLSAAATAGADIVIDWEWDDPRRQPPTIAAGASNGIALKLITAVASGTVHITAEYSEVFWS